MAVNEVQMAVKAFTEMDNTVTIACPRCNKVKSVDVSLFKGRTRFKVRCPCGNIAKYELEMRKQYRKKTELRGSYRVTSTKSQRFESGEMTVVDISRKGVRLMFKTPPSLDVGDRIKIRFTLDDANQSLVEREVIIQNIKVPYAGARFNRPNDLDNVIGFYLFK